MARSNWIGGPLLAVALATAAWGQSPATPSPAVKGGERIITLQELDLPPQKCRVLKTWKTDHGMQAYQVQSLETREMLTVVESGETVTPTRPGGPKVRAVATRIYHWGASDKPPTGCPVAPPEGVAQAVKPAVEKTSKPSPGLKPAGAQELELPPPSVLPAPTASKPVVKPTPTSTAQAKPTTTVPPPATKPVMVPPAVRPMPVPQVARPEPPKMPTPPPTMPTVKAPSTVPTRPTVTTKPLDQMPEAETDIFPAPQGAQKVGSNVVSSSPRHSKLPTGVPGKMWPAAFADQTPHPIMDPVVARQVKPKVQTRPSQVTTPPSSVTPSTQATPTSKPAAQVSKSPSKPAVEPRSTPARAEPAEPGDWRQSWGKVESKPVEPVDAGSRRLFSGRTSKPAAPPRARTTNVDPLALPDSFAKPTSVPGPSTLPAPSLTPTPSTTVKVEPLPLPTPPAALASKPAPAPVEPKPMPTPPQPAPVAVKPTPTPLLPPAPVTVTPAPKPAPTPAPAPVVTPTKAEAPKTTPMLPPVVPATTLPPAPPPPAPPAPTPLSSLPPIKPISTPTVSTTPVKPLPTPPVTVAEWKPAPTISTPAPVPAPVVTEVVPPSVTQAPQGTLPLGSGSVMAAGDPQFVPVPVVTMPDVRRAPQGPVGTAPQAPQPNRTFMAPGGAVGADAVGNAFTNPGPSRPIPTDQGKTGPMGNAFEGGAVVQAAQPPMMPPGMGYPPQMTMAPPQLVPGRPMLTPQAIPGMAQGPYQPAASPVVHAAQPYPPAGYPAPMMAQPPMMAPVQPVNYRTAQPAPTGLPTLPQTVAMLNQSDYPSQREWAADQLSELDWKQHPHVVQALTSAAKHDPAPLVRSACVRALARMGADALTVLTTVESLRNDPDPRVRDAAVESLTALKGATDAAVQRAGVRPQ